MGTSGAYGGSGSASWADAHDAFADLDASPAPSPRPDGNSPPDAQAQALAQAIARAFRKHEANLRNPPTTWSFNLNDLLASRRHSGGGTGGSVRSGSSGSTGSGRSPRSLSTNAARGAAAIAGAYALREGNGSALDELGLSLTELAQLPVRDQCVRILDDVIGAPGHPDDEALRKASYETMKAVLTAKTPPTQEETLRLFLSAYVYRAALVELRSKRARDGLSPQVTKRYEQRVKPYIARRIKSIKLAVMGRFSPKMFIEKAARLTADAVNLLNSSTP